MRPTTFAAAGLLVALATASSTPAAPAQDNSARDANDRQEAPRRWIVTFNQRDFDLDALQGAYARRADAAEIDRIVAGLRTAVHADQADFVAHCAARGVVVTHQWWLVNACAVVADPAQLDEIRRHPRVADVQADRVAKPGEMILRSTDTNNHGTDAVQAQGVLGDGVTVAVVDSGLDMDTAGRGRPHRSFFVDGDPSNPSGGGIGGSRVLANVQVGAQPAEDAINHGTPIAAVAAGEVWLHRLADRGHAPRASIVGYAVADLSSGLTTATTLTTAWQRIAAEAARYNIRVANCSYEGISFPYIVDQVAIDQLALIADVVVVGMGGNGGASSTSGYGATNMTAVGAVLPDTHAVAAFSSRGPLFGNPGRCYPDMVANGVNMDMPRADDERGLTTSQGTSYSAPQVAGAAALYVSLRPQATATEVKAALLATTSDISAANPVAPYNSKNAYGAGYLQVPALVHTARGRGLTVSSSVDPQTPLRFRLPVAQGRSYGVALAWFRQDPRQASWSNLDLEVSLAGQTIAASEQTNGTSEHLRFVASASGTLDIEVRAVSLGPNTGAGQPFSLVATDTSNTYSTGSFATFGGRCGGLLRGDANTPPEIGLPYSLLYNPRAPLPSPAILLTGSSNTQLGAITLPFDLTPLGARACWLSTSAEAITAIPFVLLGAQTAVITVPPNAALIGASVYHQAVEPWPNPLGVVTSNGIAATIGG